MKNLGRFSSITPDEIRKAAAFANFGEGNDPAEIVLEGLVSIASGFRTGYTVKCILMDLKLIGHRAGRTLTKRGKLVLYDLLRGVPLVPKIAEQAAPVSEVEIMRMRE